MKKSFVKFVWSLTGILALFLVSCQEENVVDSTQDVEEYVASAVVSLEDSAQCGRHGCFEFVFPLNISFPDGTTSEAADYESLREAIRDWKELNPDAEERPGFVYPIEVLSNDGEVVSVASAEELKAMRMECGRGFRGLGRRGHKGKHFRPCFSVVFPVTISFPDASTAQAGDRKEIKTLVREWKNAHSDTEGRPELVFPLTVEFEAGGTTTVASAEALRELKDTCQVESDEEDS